MLRNVFIFYNYKEIQNRNPIMNAINHD